MCATHEGNGVSFINGPDRYRRVGDGERKNAIIIGNRGCGAKRAPGLGIQLVGIRDLRQRTNNHLRSQAERLAHVLIAQLLKRKLSEGARIPGDLADVVASRVRCLKRSPQCIRLRGCWKEFQLYCKFHYSDYRTKERPMQTERNAAFLRAKGGGFLPTFL